MLTTAQTAELLGMHESSIKRWSNEGQINTSLTSGGHRRIDFPSFFSFVRKNKISFELEILEEDFPEVWDGLTGVKKKNDFSKINQCLLNWLIHGEQVKFVRLLCYLHTHRKVDMATLIDDVLFPVMHMVGHMWERGEVSVEAEHRATGFVKQALYELRALQISEGQGDSSHKKVAYVGCAENNQHDIGAACAATILEERGLKTHNLGANVPVFAYASLTNREKLDTLVISFSPLAKESDVLKHIGALTLNQNEKAAYNLILGGVIFEELKIKEELKKPFKELMTFSDIKSFSTWLEEKKDVN